MARKSDTGKHAMQWLLILSFSFAITAAQARIELTGPTDFYVDTGGTDAPGCGTTLAGACKTRSYFYNHELVPNYDLRCNLATIRLFGTPHLDMFVAQGAPLGLCSNFQRAEFVGVSMAQTMQVTFTGDCANPRAITVKPAGPAVLAEQGAFIAVKCIWTDGTRNNSGVPIVMGASHFSGLAISQVVFGKAPGQIDIQPGIFSVVYVFGEIWLDHTNAVGGCNLAHIQQDAFSRMTYQFNSQYPQIVTHNVNNPCYGPSAFLVNDSAVTNLCEGGPSAAFRGLITVTAASALVRQVAPGYIFNCPDVNGLIFTPEP